MKYSNYILSTLLLAIVSTPAFAATSVFVQSPNYNSASSSQYDPGTFLGFATTYDNFRLSGSYKISQIDWVGSYFNPPQQGPITSWTVSFYNDSGGQPGSICCSTTIAGTASETFLGMDNIGDPTYSYSMALPDTCCFLAGQQYWVSVVPTLSYPPQWGWESSSQGDGIAYQDFFQVRSPLATDLSFQLWGVPCSTTPEPGTLLMLGSGIVAFGGFARRKLLV